MVTGMDFVCLNCLSSLFVVFVFKIFHQFQGGGRKQICLLAFENSRVGVTWPPFEKFERSLPREPGPCEERVHCRASGHWQLQHREVHRGPRRRSGWRRGLVAGSPRPPLGSSGREQNPRQNQAVQLPFQQLSLAKSLSRWHREQHRARYANGEWEYLLASREQESSLFFGVWGKSTSNFVISFV